MKPFDLERALAGEPVITREGRKALELHLFNSNLWRPLCAVIEGKDIQVALCKNGKFYDGDVEDNDDLFMAPKTKKLWIVIEKNCDDDGNHDVISYAFHSLESLKDSVGSSDNFIIKEIEIEV